MVTLNIKKGIFAGLVLLLTISGIGCSVYQSIVNLSRLQFKLGEVNNFTIAGISISEKSSLNDFKALELLKLTASFAQGKLPVAFNLNVDAKNPNNGTGGYPSTNAVIKSFPWKLLIDGKETITGNISLPLIIPGTGEDTVIPLQINMDIVQYFKDKGYESLINLALVLGGKHGSSTKLALYAQPTVTTPLGDLKYPGEIRIINLEYSK